MEILREIDDEEVNYIIEQCSENLPYAIRCYYFLMNMVEWRRKIIEENLTDISQKCLPTFYTHRFGRKGNCTVLAITGDEDHTVFPFTFDVNELAECLMHTKLINWTHVLFITIHSDHVPALSSVISQKKGLTVLNQEFASYYWLQREEGLKMNYELPENVVFRELLEEDANLCNQAWVYKSKNSENYVRSMLKLKNGGSALVDKETKKILSFALVNEHLATGMLTTSQDEKRKGYGLLVAKHLTKMIAEKGFHPTAYINNLNEPSQRLYEKLGYEIIGEINWIMVGSNEIP